MWNFKTKNRMSIWLKSKSQMAKFFIKLSIYVLDNFYINQK
jgi:hypothetical protein